MFVMPTTASSHLGKKVLSNLGCQLRAKRFALKLRQDEAAMKCELDRSYYGGLERGERNPTLLVLDRIARAFGVSISALLKNID
jgi:transcriptional regulator with XRE-family HTH domain